MSASFPSDFTDHQFNLMVGDPSWVYEVIETEGFWTEPQGHCGGLTPDGAVGGCASRGAVSANYGETVGSGELDWSGTLPSIVPHEMFHSVQDVLDPNPMSQIPPVGEPTHRPLWFWEGGAEFFGYAVGDYAGVASYYVSPWENGGTTCLIPTSVWNRLPRGIFSLFPQRDIGWGRWRRSTLWPASVLKGCSVFRRGFRRGWPGRKHSNLVLGFRWRTFMALFDEAYQNIFDSNEDLKTYLDRECPGQWNCYVPREVLKTSIGSKRRYRGRIRGEGWRGWSGQFLRR